MMSREKIKSEVSALYLSVIIAVSLLIIFSSVAAYCFDEAGIWVFSPILTVGFWAYFTFDTYYEFMDDHLLCVSGFFREKIIYDNIKSIKMAKNFLSSMALSENRIEIRQHNKGWVMGTTYISPVNREEFYVCLINKCKNLEEENNKV